MSVVDEGLQAGDRFVVATKFAQQRGSSHTHVVAGGVLSQELVDRRELLVQPVVVGRARDLAREIWFGLQYGDIALAVDDLESAGGIGGQLLPAKTIAPLCVRHHQMPRREGRDLLTQSLGRKRFKRDSLLKTVSRPSDRRVPCEEPRVRRCVLAQPRSRTTPIAEVEAGTLLSVKGISVCYGSLIRLDQGPVAPDLALAQRQTNQHQQRHQPTSRSRLKRFHYRRNSRRDKRPQQRDQRPEESFMSPRPDREAAEIQRQIEQHERTRFQTLRPHAPQSRQQHDDRGDVEESAQSFGRWKRVKAEHRVERSLLHQAWEEDAGKSRPIELHREPRFRHDSIEATLAQTIEQRRRVVVATRHLPVFHSPINAAPRESRHH